MRPMEVPIKRADGNDEAVALLERWLKRAKEHGQIGFVGLVACENLKHVVSDYGGALQLSFVANWGLDTLKYQLLSRAHSHYEAPLEPANLAEADRICYDISAGPACFDFIAWLVLAEMVRKMAGAPAPLKVGFKMLNTAQERSLHEREREPFYKNVIFPSLSFVGAVPDAASNNAPVMEKYTLRPVVELASKGVEVPLLKPSAAAVSMTDTWLYSGKDKRAPITITLRETKGKHDFRNSNIDEWLKVAEYLEGRGERVIFIRDTALAREPITGYQTCPDAALDIHARLALYEAAKCNLFVSNGPWMLALHGTRPWLMFVETSPMSAFFPETPQFWIQWHGVHHGQFPWSLPSQRIIWERDDFGNIKKAWEELAPMLRTQEAAE